MILEYHKIDHPESRWTRTPENFRKDMQRFYEKGYQLIPMDDFRKTVSALGKERRSLILTFDDSSPGQLRFLPDEKGGYKVDPDCAVGGILNVLCKASGFWISGNLHVLPAADPPNKLF